MLLNIIIWLFFGALTGWVASLISENPSRYKTALYMVIGAIGAVVGGILVTNIFGASLASDLHLHGFLAAIPIAILCLSLFEYTSK